MEKIRRNTHKKQYLIFPDHITKTEMEIKKSKLPKVFEHQSLDCAWPTREVKIVATQNCSTRSGKQKGTPTLTGWKEGKFSRMTRTDGSCRQNKVNDGKTLVLAETDTRCSTKLFAKRMKANSILITKQYFRTFEMQGKKILTEKKTFLIKAYTSPSRLASFTLACTTTHMLTKPQKAKTIKRYKDNTEQDGLPKEMCRN